MVGRLPVRSIPPRKVQTARGGFGHSGGSVAGAPVSAPRARTGGPARALGFRWFIPIVTIGVILALVALPAAVPGPSFSLGPVTSQRYCHIAPEGGNYSYWLASFDLANHGASASAAVAVLVDGTPVATEHVYVASGATTGVHANVTNPAIGVDALCAPHNVTVGVWGYLL